MGVRATVEPKVVAGTERGGEDLFLLFTAYEDNKVEGVLLELKDGDDLDWYYEEENEEESEEDEHKGKVYSCTTVQYEFTWEGTHQDLLELYKEQGGDDTTTWNWYGPVSEPPKKRFYLEHFVDGNAD